MTPKKSSDEDQNTRICSEGRLAFVARTVHEDALPSWLAALHQKSRQLVGWDRMGGRVCLYTTGDVRRVKMAIMRLIKEGHDPFKVVRSLETDSDSETAPT